MKINNYIKYLLTLILLQGINIYAQASGSLNQIISQAQQEVSNITLPLNLSSIINSPITKYLTSTLGSSFLGFVIPFLFVFGVLTFLTYIAKKEINRPLLLIYFIIDLLITIFFPAILLLFAIALAIVLFLYGLYKLFHTLTRSRIGGITGAAITLLIVGVLLNNGINIIGFLFSSAFYVLLFMFFIFMFIYGYKVSQSSDIKKLKKIIYHIHTPQDARNLKNIIEQTAHNFESDADQIKNKIDSLINQLPQIGKPQNVKTKPIIKLLGEIKDDLKNFYNTYKQIKIDIKNNEIIINKHYNEPLRSHLLNILYNGEKRINQKAQEVRSECSDKLLRNKKLIIGLSSDPNYQNTVKGIYKEIENIMNRFHIY